MKMKTNVKTENKKSELLLTRLMKSVQPPEILTAEDVPITFGSKYGKICLMNKFLFCLFCSTQKEHEIEEYLRKKYADDSVAARHFGDGGEEMSDEITQQTLLPGVK